METVLSLFCECESGIDIADRPDLVSPRRRGRLSLSSAPLSRGREVSPSRPADGHAGGKPRAFLPIDTTVVKEANREMRSLAALVSRRTALSSRRFLRGGSESLNRRERKSAHFEKVRPPQGLESDRMARRATTPIKAKQKKCPVCLERREM